MTEIKDKLSMFQKGMLNKFKSYNYVSPSTARDKQFLKNQILEEVKTLFEAIDEDNSKKIIDSSLDLSMYSFFIANEFGK